LPARVGCSGWSYDDWVGRVYPRALEPGDWLAFYARAFSTVEVNSTFYRTPPRGIVAGWIEKARDVPGFELSVKAPQSLTQDLLAEGTVEQVARAATAWRLLVADRLRDAGRLGAVLLQLAPQVRDDDATRGRLDAALRALDGLPVAVEFRHTSWVGAQDALALLDAHDAALVLVDGPGFPLVEPGAASHVYARFHGRNDDIWLRKKPEGDARLNRYDYRYSSEELAPWAERLARLARRRLVRVYFNNHPGGNAVFDAQAFEGLLEGTGGPVQRAAIPKQRGLDAFD